MIIYCFWQLNEIAKPIYRPKGIYLINLKKLTIFSVTLIVCLVNKIKNLSAKAEYRENSEIWGKYFFKLLSIIHLNSDIYTVDKKFIYLWFSSISVFIRRWKLCYHIFKYFWEFLLKQFKVWRVVICITLLNIRKFLLVEILYIFPDPW